MTDRRNPWTTEASHQVYANDLVRLEHHSVRHSSGNLATYLAIRFKVCGVRILPIDRSGFTYLVGQYRYVPDQFTWELVGGAGDLSQPLEAARRELKEEIGFEGDNWLECLRLLPSGGLSDEQTPCYVVWDLTEGAAQPDATETVSRRRLAFKDAVAGCFNGEIRDAPSVATILAVYAGARQGTLPPALQDVLHDQIQEGSSQ